MSTITTINASDQITNSRTVINTNFSNLNTDKIETSVIDTDTALAANSDAKIPSQKAVKTYIDTVGGANASTTVRGIVEEATVAEIGAGTAAGATGARLFVNPSSTVSTSAGAADVGKIPRLNASGKLDPTFLASFSASQTSHDLSSTAAQTIAHGLGGTPRFVKVSIYFTNAVYANTTFGIYTGGAASQMYLAIDYGSVDSVQASGSMRVYTADAVYAEGSMQAPDGTNININWTKSGSPTGTATIVTEAYL